MKTTSISMTTPDPTQIAAVLRDYSWELASAGLLLIVVATMLMLFMVRHRQRRRLAAIEAGLHALQADLGALCSSVAGFGERLVRIEQQQRSVVERQDQIELRSSGGDHAYSHAIRLVHKGADVNELVSTCGLNRGEAELLLRLHGLAQAS